MGTTLTAMQAGSVATVRVLCIEGLSYLLCEGPTAPVITAWAGTDWTDAQSDCVIKYAPAQTFHPYQAFNGGGSAELWVQPGDTTAADRFGIDTHRTTSGYETELASTALRGATTLTVLDTSAWPSSGTGYIGHECFTYTGKTGTTFTGCTRGLYGMLTDSGSRLAGYHRVGAVEYGTNIQPLVTQYRRTWVGARIEIYEHRVVAGVLDVKAQAQRVFAGRIAEIRVDPETGWTCVSMEHVLDEIKDATLLRDQYRATISEGCYLTAGATLSAFDDSGGSSLTANDLTVVSGTPGANEIAEGYYTADLLIDAINSWLADELTATRLHVTAKLAIDSTGGDERTVITFKFASAGANAVNSFTLTLPNLAATLLGFTTSPSPYAPWESPVLKSNASSTRTYTSDGPVLWTTLTYGFFSSTTHNWLQLTDEQGTFFDNYAYMPASYDGQPMKPATAIPILDTTTREWGVFLVDNKHVMTAARVGSDLHQVGIFTSLLGSKFTRADSQGGIPIVQIAAIQDFWSLLLIKLFYSSGSSTFNHADYDVFGYGLGLTIPGSWLGGDFETSCVGGTSAQHIQPMWIKQPMKLSDLVNADCIIRGQFLVWKNGALTFAQWSTPYTGSGTTLDQTNKAEPVGNKITQRSATTISKEWAKPIIKIESGYDWVNDKYTDPVVVIEDRTAIDDGGGDPVTIKCRNLTNDPVYGDLQYLLPGFLARAPLYSRPMHRLRRSIDCRYYEGLAPGDHVLVTDTDARDPSTGARGVTARPGMIISHRFDPGGMGIDGEVTQMTGEVEIFFLPINRIGAYSPAAQVDDTATNGGYNAATFALTCYAHEHSETTASADAASFAANDVVLITEIDPATTSAPLQWSRTLASVSGNVITPTAALSSPAWDSTKKYRITSEIFSNATATQDAYAYQASATTGLLDSSAPFQYGIGIAEAYTTEDHTELAELAADSSYDVQAARDVGYDRGLVRTINNLIDHKTAHQSPYLFRTALTSAGTSGYRLVACSPVWLGSQYISGTTRDLYVAPMFKSTDGTSASVRVTLLARRPVSTSIDDVTRIGPYSEATWTTTSTTAATGAETALSMDIMPPSGLAWLLIEITPKCSTRGLAQCIERERRTR